MASQAITTVSENTPANSSPEAAHFGLMQRKAQLFASSPLIPEALRAGGLQQALANCYIGLTMAEAMGENPLTVLQNIHIVKGKAGFSAQFMIARANASGVFKGRINWRMSGQGEGLRAEAFATLAETGEEVSFAVDMAMAKAEGWTSNPKYRSVPHLMLRYRSATFLVRLYAPDVMFGYQTAEEVEDVAYAAAPEGEAQPLSAAMLIEQARPAEAHPANDGTLSEDNPTAAEGPADEDRGDGFTEDEPAELIELRAALMNARTAKDVGQVDAEWCQAARNRLSDEDATKGDSLITARKRELMG